MNVGQEEKRLENVVGDLETELLADDLFVFAENLVADEYLEATCQETLVDPVGERT